MRFVSVGIIVNARSRELLSMTAALLRDEGANEMDFSGHTRREFLIETYCLVFIRI